MINKFSLIVHCGYTETQVGLYNKAIPVVTHTLMNKEASAQLIPLIDTFLQQHTCSLKDMLFIAAHAGPAPFTSLRVALATVNGLGYGSDVPLIGISGLECFLHEYTYSTDITVVLLNAFCDDIYYGIRDNHTQEIIIGCMPFADFLNSELVSNKNITCIGYGTQMYEKRLRDWFGDRLVIPDPFPGMVSMDAIAQQAYLFFNAGLAEQKPIAPVYLKAYSAKLGKVHEK